MVKKKRDYKAEYRRRIERGRAKGLSRSQARGHPRSGERHASKRTSTPLYDRKLEAGLKEMRKGKSLKSAARSVRVSPERLRHYVAETGVVKKEKRRWVVKEDHRPRQMLIYSGGQALEITVPDYESSKKVGTYMEDVKKFLRTNDRSRLAPHVGEWVTDINSRSYPFETRPNALYRIHASGVESFENVYRHVS
jgi:hypothetical protein